MSMKNLSFIPIKEGDNILFYINTGGFPLDRDAWSHLWSHAEELQPSASYKIQMLQEKKDKLPDVAFPQVPYTALINKKYTVKEKLEKIQDFINKLQYNHTGLQFFEIRKDRPLIGLTEVAKKIIDDSLPIKCLEAVILAIYLINEIPTQLNVISKFTIGFKTISKRNVHRHVVLGLYCHFSGHFGTIGLSRRDELGFKELKYKSLTHLIQDYIDSYSTYLHKVKRIKIGKPIIHSNRSFESIPWNGCTIVINSSNYHEWPKQVEKHARFIRHYTNTSLIGSGTGSSLIKQSTSLSFKNLSSNNNKLNSNNKTKSYLNLHLEKLNRKNKKKIDTESEVDIDESVDSDSADELEASDDEENNKISNKLNRNSLLLSRTAASNFSQSNNNSKLTSSNSITTLSLLTNEKKNKNPLNASYYCTSGNFFLKNKKNKSLRV